MSIGDNVKVIRKERKLTQSELAKKMNISRSYLSDIENNRKNPSSKTLESLAEKLNISMFYLTTGEKTLRDLTDDEKNEVAKVVGYSLGNLQKDIGESLKKELELILNSEMDFVKRIYLLNVINFMGHAKEDDLIQLASCFQILNRWDEIKADDSLTQEEIEKYVDEELKDFEDFLKNYLYK